MKHKTISDVVHVTAELSLKNRIVLAPLYYEWEFGSRAFSRFFEARARGGVALAMVPVPTHGGLSDLSAPLFIERSKIFLDMMHSLGCKVVPQLFSGVGEEVNSQSLEQLAILPAEFAIAAQTLKAIGYDGVEVHGAHHSLYMSLISPAINERSDIYGGNEKNRFELPLTTVKAMRVATGNFPIFYRFSADEFAPGGMNIDIATRFAAALEQAGASCIDVSAGGTLISPQYSDAPGEEYEEGCFVQYSAEIKKKISIPAIVAGRINSKKTADKILMNNHADLLAIGRVLVKNAKFPLQLIGEAKELV
jgi:2,4-dienoyl-CoA reductase-like NADH-dependent reductase (Old Yellow Enzyme family)